MKKSQKKKSKSKNSLIKNFGSVFFKVLLVVLTLLVIGVATGTDLSNIRNIAFGGTLTIGGVSGHIAPQGTIIMFEGSCPSGWTEKSSWQGRYVLASSTSGVTGGSDSHSHSISGTLSTTGSSHDHDISTSGTTSSSSHTHSFSASVSIASESSHVHSKGTFSFAGHTHGSSFTHSHTHNWPFPQTTSSGSTPSQISTTMYSSNTCPDGHTHTIGPFNIQTNGASATTVTGTTGSGGSGAVVGSGNSGAGSSHSHTLADSSLSGTTSSSSHSHSMTVTGTSNTASSAHTHNPGTIALLGQDSYPSHRYVVLCQKN
jgi:mating pheromone-induced death protein 2